MLRFTTVALFAIACSASLAGEYKLKKPGLLTNPVKYVKRFPLNNVSKAELVEKIGVPDGSMDIANQTYLSYKLGEGFGAREWIYVVADGVVVDVLYKDRGPYNGISAKGKQAGN